ncbi:hypothetical protein B0H14DRAFT_2894067, partial [Mycena olivaceomarginata]
MCVCSKIPLYATATATATAMLMNIHPQYPEKAKFLTSAERPYLCDVLAKDSAGLSKKFEIKFFCQAVGDYNSYLYALVFLKYGAALYLWSSPCHADDPARMICT